MCRCVLPIPPPLLMLMMPRPAAAALWTVRVDRVEPEEAEFCDAASWVSEVKASSELLFPPPPPPSVLPLLPLLSLPCRLPIPGRRCCVLLLFPRPAGRMTESIPSLLLFLFLFFSIPSALPVVHVSAAVPVPVAALPEPAETDDAPVLVSDDMLAEIHMEVEEEEKLWRRSR